MVTLYIWKIILNSIITFLFVFKNIITKRRKKQVEKAIIIRKRRKKPVFSRIQGTFGLRGQSYYQQATETSH